MKPIFKIALLMLSIIIVLTSCEKGQLESNEDCKAVDILSFNSTKDFLTTFDDLAKLSYEEQIKWNETYGINTSLYFNKSFCNDEIMLNMPRAFQILFNKNMEIQINDSIIRFDKGSLYMKSYKSKPLPIPILWGKVWINDNIETPLTKAQYSTPYNKIGASFQTNIEIPNNKYKFKYVHELKSVGFTITNNQSHIMEHVSRLFLVLKLEYKGSSWHEAGEARNIYIDLNICKINLLGVSKNQEILIDTNSFSNTSTPHIINISGNIIHEVIGYPGTRKTNWWNAPYLPWS